MLHLNAMLAREHRNDLRLAAERGRMAALETPVSRVTLREASAADARRLRELAHLDCAVPLRGPALVAEVDGRIRAAIPLRGGTAIADPFHRGCELVELLRLRAAQLGRI